MNRRRAGVLSMLVAPLLLMMGLTVSSAQASATNIVNIPGELDACKGVAQNVGLTKHEGGFNAGVYNTFGKSYPVILVHGLDGKDKGQWGDLDQSTDLAARIDSVSNAVVATEFQYKTVGPPGDSTFFLHWRPLADAIHCIATISRGNGGPGKVIAVGYSEGSAILHGAASLKSADGSYAISDEVGQAVTVADARVTFGILPTFPAPNFSSKITVHAIAGNILKTTRKSDGSYGHITTTFSDGVVATRNALWQYTKEAAGGGTFIAKCYDVYEKYNALLDWYSGKLLEEGGCEHGNLLRDSPETQWDIVDAITAFVNAHCTGAEPSSSPTNLAAAAVPMAGKTSPAPTPTPTDPGTPGTPGVPGGDPTAPTSPPTTPPSGCVA